VEFLRTSPSATSRAEVEKAFSKLEIHRENIMDCYSKLMQEDPDNLDVYGQKMDEADASYLDAAEIITKALHGASVAAAPPVTAPPVVQSGGQHQYKVQLALKPEKLTRDSTPAELRSWIRKFRAFYSMSGLHEASIPDQQAFLFQCIDIDLETTLRQNINENTEIFGDDSCIEKIEDKFKLTYPLFTRRLDYFRYEQSKGQSFSDFYAHLRQLGDEAELPGLNVDDMYVFRMICGCSDQRLKEKFLKLESPTLEDLHKESELYEMAKRALKAFDKGSSLNGQSYVKRVKASDFQGKCYGCGQAHHESKEKECKAWGKVCHRCNKKNHFARFCLRSNFKGAQQTNKKESRSRPNTRSNSLNRQDAKRKQKFEESTVATV
jgi:hypothetical protein